MLKELSDAKALVLWHREISNLVAFNIFLFATKDLLAEIDAVTFKRSEKCFTFDCEKVVSKKKIECKADV